MVVLKIQSATDHMSNDAPVNAFGPPSFNCSFYIFSEPKQQFLLANQTAIEALVQDKIKTLRIITSVNKTENVWNLFRLIKTYF